MKDLLTDLMTSKIPRRPDCKICYRLARSLPGSVDNCICELDCSDEPFTGRLVAMCCKLNMDETVLEAIAQELR